MRKFYNGLLLQLLALCLTSFLCAGHVYVRSDGPADGDGKSWETAFNSIDAAILNIQTHPDDLTFWVAEGIYSPVTLYAPDGVVGGAAGSSFTRGLQTFDLPDGVKIYGGFKGCEKELSDRKKIHNPLYTVDNRYNPSEHTPKAVVDYSLTVLNGAGSEAWHVITAGNDIAKTGVNIGLFDLTIKGGYADGPDAGTVDSQFSLVTLDYAHDAGGGLYSRFGSHVDIFNVQFINNASSAENATILPKGQPTVSGGGAIAAFDAGTVTNIDNCYFKDNTAFVFGVGGGAISSNFQAALNVANSLFEDNTSNRTGGAIRSREAGDAFIAGCYFSRNIATDLNHILDEAGGAIEIFQASLKLENSTFIDNEALVSGGAVFFHTFLDDGKAHSLDLSDCYFEGNTSGPFGGGAITVFGQGQHVGSAASISNSKFVKNSAGLGGAIYNDSFATKIKYCCFTENQADAWGGAIQIDNFGAALLFPPLAFSDRPITKVSHCKFLCNSTRGVQPISLGFPPFFTPPGILNLFATLAPVINNLNTVGTVSQTIVSGGGAVAVLLAGVAKIKDCEFDYNRAKDGTGGGILVGGATGTVTDLATHQTFNTFDFATAVVKRTIFKKNRPNNAVSVDLDNVGIGRDGVTLIFE